MSRRRYRAPLIGACLVGLVWLVLWVYPGEELGSLTDQRAAGGQAQSGPEGVAGDGGPDAEGEQRPARSKGPTSDGPDMPLSGQVASGSAAMERGADESHKRPPGPQYRAFYMQPLAEVLTEAAWISAELKVEDGGVSLSGRPNALNPRRVGRITSPGVKMDFASNMLSPLWKADMPEGTELSFELAVSQDGDNWSPWNSMEADADAMGAISPRFPDGRPNPNYGFTPGGILGYGLEKWLWFRYRITLSSEGAASPTVSAVRVFYQDTTLGKGRLAEL